MQLAWGRCCCTSGRDLRRGKVRRWPCGRALWSEEAVGLIPSEGRGRSLLGLTAAVAGQAPRFSSRHARRLYVPLSLRFLAVRKGPRVWAREALHGRRGLGPNAIKLEVLMEVGWPLKASTDAFNGQPTG